MKSTTKVPKNIGILSRFPEDTVNELIECGFMERRGLDGSIVCFPRSRMHVRAVMDFLNLNHIEILIIERDFKFEFYGEDFGEPEFMKTLRSCIHKRLSKV